MKVIVFGNIASGKTTLLSKINEEFSFDIVAIDDFRRKFGDGSNEAELIARSKFFTKIISGRNQFIECLGVGKVADQLFDLLYESNEVILCVILNTPKEICIERLSNRTWDIPFPKPIEEVFDLVERTEVQILNEQIQQKWNNRGNTTLIHKDNIEPEDIDLIASEIIISIQQNVWSQLQSQTDIKDMLSDDVQRYYSNEYHTYQKAIVTKDKFSADRLMVERFLVEENVKGSVVDIGAGNCQWFPLLEQTVSRYFAIEVNDTALSMSPSSEKILKIRKNVFAEDFNLKEVINDDPPTAMFSFFLSHFSNHSINQIFQKLGDVNSVVIIDSFWGCAHQEKFSGKDLNVVRRRISEKDYITLPKRFFDCSDLSSLLKPFGFTVSKFIEGNYWFACSLKR